MNRMAAVLAKERAMKMAEVTGFLLTITMMAVMTAKSPKT